MNTEIIVPREKNFRLREGHFPAKISHVVVKPTRGGREDSQTVFIHFEVAIGGMERYECCARGIFPFDLSSGSQLRRFLQNLLGYQFFVEHSNQRIDLNTVLQDMNCEIDLVHGKHDEKYDWPMVLFENISPVAPANKGQPKK